jgi:pimeloyl-ACP methyl ester carboxylesterase
VDPDALAIVGFSRGGLLTLQAALLWPELWRAVVLMAPAPANNTLIDTLADVIELAAPVLLQVSENDRFQSDHVQHVADIEVALEDAGKPYESILYPPYGDDGHELFWEVQEPYWSDLVAFLDGQL